MKCLRLWLVLLGLLTASLSQAEDDCGMQSALDTARETLGVPGLQVAAVHAGGLCQAVSGVADVETQTPLTTQHMMPGGSTGKTFAAVTLLQLVEAGDLSLDEPVAKYFGGNPWFDRLPNASTMTVRHVLTHSTGMRDHVETANFAMRVAWGRWSGRDYYMTPQELLALLADDTPLFAAGEGFNYTDSGYLLVGLLIERITQKPYYEILRERVLQPHGLDAVRAQTTQAAQGVATGYGAFSVLNVAARLWGAVLEDGRFLLDPRLEYTGGGLITRTDLLARFYHKLANAELLSEGTLSEMLSAGYAVPQQARYGYGVYVGDGVFGHGGWFPGYSTLVRHHVDDNLTLAVQTNTDADVDLGSVLRQMRAVLSATQPSR